MADIGVWPERGGGRGSGRGGANVMADDLPGGAAVWGDTLPSQPANVAKAKTGLRSKIGTMASSLKASIGLRASVPTAANFDGATTPSDVLSAHGRGETVGAKELWLADSWVDSPELGRYPPKPPEI